MLLTSAAATAITVTLSSMASMVSILGSTLLSPARRPMEDILLRLLRMPMLPMDIMELLRPMDTMLATASLIMVDHECHRRRLRWR